MLIYIYDIPETKCSLKTLIDLFDNDCAFYKTKFYRFSRREFLAILYIVKNNRTAVLWITSEEAPLIDTLVLMKPIAS